MNLEWRRIGRRPMEGEEFGPGFSFVGWGWELGPRPRALPLILFLVDNVIRLRGDTSLLDLNRQTRGSHVLSLSTLCWLLLY